MGRLFWKFFWSILLAQLVVSLGIGLSFWLKDRAREQVVIDTSPSAEFLAESAAATLRHGGSAAMGELLASMRHRVVYAVDDSGRDLLDRPVKPELVAQARTLLASAGARHSVRSVPTADGHHFLIFGSNDGRHGPGGPPPDGHEQDHGGPGQPPPDMHGPGGGDPGRPPLPPGHLFPNLLPLLGATLASLLFAAILAWYFARPIRALRNAFEAAAGGDLAPRFGDSRAGSGDELSDLGRDFDRMSTRLCALMDGQRRLLHDVSHELRSPLARLQAAIGLAHQQPDKLAASLERIDRESVRMDKLVGELLTLSRLEAAAPMALNEELSITDIVNEIAADARFEAAAQQRDIVVSGMAEVMVRGTGDMLWRAIENVVRNALKHSYDGGAVDIRLQVDADVRHVCVSVLDRGPGIAEGELQQIFRPFFRANPAHNNTDGHGLGLAIAQRVIDAHGGTIRAANRPGGGLAVDITLPIASKL